MVDEAYRRYCSERDRLDERFKRWCLICLIVMAITGVIFAFFPRWITAFFFVNAIISLRVAFLRYDDLSEELEESYKNARKSFYSAGEATD